MVNKHHLSEAQTSGVNIRSPCRSSPNICVPRRGRSVREKKWLPSGQRLSVGCCWTPEDLKGWGWGNAWKSIWKWHQFMWRVQIASSCYACSLIGTEHVTNVKVTVAVTRNGLMGPRFTYVYLMTRQYLKKFSRLCLDMHENNLALLSFENCHGLCEPFFTTLH